MKKKATSKQHPSSASTNDEQEFDEKKPFLKRLLFGQPQPDMADLEAGSTTILDILSPTTIDTKSRDYLVVDGIFHAYLYTSQATATPPPSAPAGSHPWSKPVRASA